MLDAETNALVLMSISITQRQWPQRSHVCPLKSLYWRKAIETKIIICLFPLSCSVWGPPELGFTRARLGSRRGTWPRAAGIGGLQRHRSRGVTQFYQRSFHSQKRPSWSQPAGCSCHARCGGKVTWFLASFHCHW